MNWIKKLLVETKANANEKHDNKLRAEAEAIIQMREFHGKVFISFDGIPLIESVDIKLLEEIRKTYIEYSNK